MFCGISNFVLATDNYYMLNFELRQGSPTNYFEMLLAPRGVRIQDLDGLQIPKIFKILQNLQDLRDLAQLQDLEDNFLKICTILNVIQKIFKISEILTIFKTLKV